VTKGEPEPPEETEKRSFSDFGDDARSRWANIVRRFEGPLRGFFANRVKNPADIDDLVQAVFLQLLQRNNGESIEYVQQYLFQAAANVLRDQHRRSMVRHGDQHQSYDEELHAVGTEISMERILIAQESVALVMSAINQLPERTREVFFLRGIGKRPHDEVALMLGISRRVVHKHMARAFKHLGRVLGELD
jgi:RNA polymerase sigma factor (sigma-70 family)